MLKTANILLICLICLICSKSYAQPPVVQKVVIEPLVGGISFNTVDLYCNNGWVTMPTVEMKGRKEVSILNTMTGDNVYITGVSGSSAKGIIYPREEVCYKAASSLHIYASSSTVTASSVIVTEIR